MANEDYAFPKKIYVIHEVEDADDPDDEGYLVTYEDKDDLSGRDDIVAEYELKRQGEVSTCVHIKFDKE